jgi:hypothetical protein
MAKDRLHIELVETDDLDAAEKFLVEFLEVARRAEAGEEAVSDAEAVLVRLRAIRAQRSQAD